MTPCHRPGTATGTPTSPRATVSHLALAHPTEIPDYYTRLATLEREAAADLQKKK